MAHEIRGGATGGSASGRRRRVALSAGLGALVATAAYVGIAIHGKDTVAAGTSVAGHHIGGMSRAEAVSVLRGIRHPSYSRAATVRADEHSFRVDAGRSYQVDAEKTLSRYVGFSLHPASVWRHATGAGPRLPVFRLDRGDLQARVKRSAQSLDGAPHQGTVKFVAGKVVRTAGAAGQGVDVAATAQQITNRWPGTTQYTTRLVTVQPDATDSALARFAAGDGARAMSAPLRLRRGGHSLTLTPEEVSEVISTAVERGTPRLAVDGRALEQAITSRTTDFIQAPQDARVVWKAGKPAVADGVDGRKIDRERLAGDAAKALVGNHLVDVPTSVDAPQVRASDIDLEHLPTTPMARFTSAFPQGPSQAARIHNITTAVRRINGTVVLPGQQFSLLRTLGYDLSKERGYVEAGTLQNGMHVDGMGGGVSQVSTVVYNTAFFSGVQLGVHTPHAVWIPRYPMGREATLWNPSIDNTWTNDTGQPILMTAQVSSGRVSMEFRGAKKYDVSTRTSEKYRVTPPRHRIVRGVPGCQSSAGSGTAGFAVDVWRTLTAHGSHGASSRSEKVHTTYAPDDVISCR